MKKEIPENADPKADPVRQAHRDPRVSREKKVIPESAAFRDARGIQDR